MARQPRFILPGQPQHVIQRSNWLVEWNQLLRVVIENLKNIWKQ